MAPRPHFLAPLLEEAPGELQLVAAGLERPVATRLMGAFDSRSRTKGLLGRTSLPDGAAMIIAPCNSVHTFGMKFAIDLIYAARDGRVLKVRENMVKNRMSFGLRAFAVVELAAGTVGRTGVKAGDMLEIASVPST